MESYIPISYLNDFVFCPRSIYFHQLHGRISTRLYQGKAQIDGKAVHEAVDNQTYSTRKNVLQGIDIYCQQYGICGKIDIFDIDIGLLTERKKYIAVIYDGYIFQLYAQYFSLTEMGHTVKTMRFYSSDDNKVYPVKLPEDNPEMLGKFEQTVYKIKTYKLSDHAQDNPEKCKNCIYETICDQSLYT
ncbi:MAG: type V CRISPR-associated protein Cas4 [Phycisphaerae bacterium]|nr:type V CRISPR-associated protein Cas4 [Phycisphaerae bacterium]